MLLKIGVDARLLSRELTGIGRYTLEMCRALKAMEEVQLFLYSPAPMIEEARFLFRNCTIREASFKWGPFRQLWTDTLLPLWGQRDQVDVLWGPAHRLPRWIPDRRIARVVTIHDLVWRHAPQTMRALSRLNERLNMPSAVRCADMLLIDSEATAKAVEKEFKIPRTQMKVVLPGVSKLVRSAKPLSEEVPFCGNSFALFVGTLEPRKNLKRLLHAYSLLNGSEKEHTPLVIAGGVGWGNEQIRKVVDKYSLSEYVHFVGRVDDAMLDSLYAHCSFVVMPSLYEGFGLPLVEGMSHGKPVVTSRVASMPEVAGKAGILVDPLDVMSIYSGIKRMITDSAFSSQLALNATQQASKFDWGVAAENAYKSFTSAVRKRLARDE